MHVHSHLTNQLNKFKYYLSNKNHVNAYRESRLENLRMENMQKFLNVAHRVLVIVIAGIVIAAEVSGAPDKMVCIAGVNALALVGMELLQSAPLTQRRIDVAFLVGSILSILHILHDAMAQNDVFLLRFGRYGMTTLLSVLYMRSEISAVSNLLKALATCWTFTQTELCVTGNSPHSAAFLCLGEMFVYVCTTTVCVLTEAWFADLLQNEAEAIGAKQAVERLLHGLCDAVVDLDSDLRIIKAAPQLLHLMCPTTPIEPKAIEGGLLTNHFASESDKDNFTLFVASTSMSAAGAGEALKGPAPALHVNLHHALGLEVPVELFHVRVHTKADEWQHLIGIREVRKEPRA